MGFLGQATASKPYPVIILLSGYQAHATLNVYGMLQTFLNDDQKGNFPLGDVTLYGLESDNPAASISIPELIVRKDQCHALIFEQNLSRDESGLLPRAEPLALYTSHYAIQGHCHMGPEAYISDFIETSRALFIGATEVSIFPLFRPRTAVIQQAPTVFIHRSAVRMHHRV